LNNSTSGFIEELPVFDYYQAITEAVDANQVTIITAETGAGKSTQIPQYLLEHGYSKIVVTQPRILAARNLARRVREEWTIHTGIDNDQVVGYRTAHERDDSPDTKILYCTDGLQLVREITGVGVSNKQVLVLDEVHEWNENMEVLVAWAKKRCQEDPRFKVVIMSATIETESLATYFDTTAVINVPGRSFEVTKRAGTDVVSEISALLMTARKNVLVFLQRYNGYDTKTGQRSGCTGYPAPWTTGSQCPTTSICELSQRKNYFINKYCSDQCHD
jgi:HrpA-like RNA helicase